MIQTLGLVASLLSTASSAQVIAEKPPEVTVQGARFENLTQGGRYAPGGNYLSWRRQERSDPQAQWQKSANVYSTRYQILSVASRNGGSELFVAGVFSNGVSVIERWQFAPRPGRWQHAYTGPSLGMGTSLGPYSGSQSIVGGTYAAPPAVWYAPTITLVLETDALGTIRSVAVDPEGRFLVFNTFPSGDVYQIDLMDAPTVPVLRFTASQIPSLVGASTLEISQNSSLGRVCVVLPPHHAFKVPDVLPQPEVVYLVDADNDGFFEDSQVVDLVEHLASVFAPDEVMPWSEPWIVGG